MPSLAELIGNPAVEGVELLQAKVTAYTDEAATIHFGNPAETISNVRMLASPAIAVGDAVWVLRSGGVLLIVGPLQKLWHRKGPIWNTACIAPASPGSTTSTAFVDYPGPTDFTIAKQITNSILMVQGAVGMYVSTNNTQAAWGVRINSVDTEVCAFYFNTAGQHQQLYGNQWVASGLAAGSYTMRVRWKSNTAPSQINSDGNDKALFTVTEWPL